MDSYNDILYLFQLFIDNIFLIPSSILSLNSASVLEQSLLMRHLIKNRIEMPFASIINNSRFTFYVLNFNDYFLNIRNLIIYFTTTWEFAHAFDDQRHQLQGIVRALFVKYECV